MARKGYDNWPTDMHPDGTPVYTYDEVEMAAPADVVWAWLIRAEQWPEWYRYWSEANILNHEGPDLRENSAFTVKTGVLRMPARVQDFQPKTQLAWGGKSYGVAGYHSWVIEPRLNGCLVITEETQKGWLVWLLRGLMQRIIRRRHKAWLKRLEIVALRGMPEGTKSADVKVDA